MRRIGNYNWWSGNSKGHSFDLPADHRMIFLASMILRKFDQGLLIILSML